MSVRFSAVMWRTGLFSLLALFAAVTFTVLEPSVVDRPVAAGFCNPVAGLDVLIDPHDKDGAIARGAAQYADDRSAIELQISCTDNDWDYVVPYRFEGVGYKINSTTWRMMWVYAGGNNASCDYDANGSGARGWFFQSSNTTCSSYAATPKEFTASTGSAGTSWPEGNVTVAYVIATCSSFPGSVSYSSTTDLSKAGPPGCNMPSYAYTENSSYHPAETIFFDTVDPVTTWVTPNPDAYTSATSYTFDWAFNDASPSSGYYQSHRVIQSAPVTAPGVCGAWSNYSDLGGSTGTGAYTLTFPTANTMCWRLAVRTQDNSGNWSPWAASGQTIRDTEAPIVTFKDGMNGWTAGAETACGAAAGSGPSVDRWCLAGSQLRTYWDQYDFGQSFANTGTRGTGIDYLAIGIDRASPTSPGVCPSAAGSWTRMETRVVDPSAVAQDAYSTWNVSNGYCYKWAITVHDKAANSASSSADAIIFDTTAPSASVTAPGSTYMVFACSNNDAYCVSQASVTPATASFDDSDRLWKGASNGSYYSQTLDTSDKREGSAALRFNITGLPAGAAASAGYGESLDLSTVAGSALGNSTDIALDVKVSTLTNLDRVRLQFNYEDGSSYCLYTISAAEIGSAGSWITDIEEFSNRWCSGTTDDEHVAYVVVGVQSAAGGAYSGTVWVDNLRIGDAQLPVTYTMSDATTGVQTATISKTREAPGGVDSCPSGALEFDDWTPPNSWGASNSFTDYVVRNSGAAWCYRYVATVTDQADNGPISAASTTTLVDQTEPSDVVISQASESDPHIAPRAGGGYFFNPYYSGSISMRGTGEDNQSSIIAINFRNMPEAGWNFSGTTRNPGGTVSIPYAVDAADAVVTARATNRAGLRSQEVATFGWYRDEASPTLGTFTTPGASAAGTNLSWSWTANDTRDGTEAGSGYQDAYVTIDRAPATGGSCGSWTSDYIDAGWVSGTSYTSPALEDGYCYRLNARLRDNVGNQHAIGSPGTATDNEVTTEVTILDNTPPVSTATIVSGTSGLNGWYTTPVTVSIDSMDAGAGFDTTTPDMGVIKYRINGGSVITCDFATCGQPDGSMSLPLDLATDGTHSITYWAIDALGNTEGTHTLTVKVDTTPPQGCMITAVDETTATTVDVTLSGCTDAGGLDGARFGDEVGYNWNDAFSDIGWVDYSGGSITRSVTLESGSGDYKILVQVRDEAGNIAFLDTTTTVNTAVNYPVLGPGAYIYECGTSGDPAEQPNNDTGTIYWTVDSPLCLVPHIGQITPGERASGGETLHSEIIEPVLSYTLLPDPNDVERSGMTYPTGFVGQELEPPTADLPLQFTFNRETSGMEQALPVIVVPVEITAEIGWFDESGTQVGPSETIVSRVELRVVVRNTGRSPLSPSGQ